VGAGKCVTFSLYSIFSANVVEMSTSHGSLRAWEMPNTCTRSAKSCCLLRQSITQIWSSVCILRPAVDPGCFIDA
jgi:hypothetical protein